MTQDNFIGEIKILFSRSSDVIIIPKWRYHDIDTHDDWKKAEKIIDAGLN